MEEDEETYGFGSFSDLFGAAPAAAKRLDVGALSRFCMPERLLSRFQQQQRRDKPSVLYQHVAAKFDGVSIDGGLGALSFTSLEGGGVVWQQTAASDSDALERRKKELQDITNQPQNDVKSAAAVFVRLKQVETVRTTSMQNKVQGVEMVLKGGNRLEVTFMPGPFFKATHRDEFLTLLKEKMITEGEQVEEVGKNSEVEATEMHTTGRNLDGFTDRQRELHTKAKHSRNDDDLFEYTDTGTGALIPVRIYEQRYLNYVKAHEVNPVLHMFPVPEMEAHEEKAWTGSKEEYHLTNFC
ncbi:hypothetical protein BBJ29_002257 [Phytophthora kernoviae]|uniref:Uncharacterized protein n=1 Tax=Phytophthora kernoviae TaxID=325452 RepID=A0A3F2RQL3_9STRA|nr:hypothetical protein BBJ29_002257 [Phytophthora kernoviae]RLN62278.1 hypothetical protein BBP00_00004859 [Phytophthora kernoviae]